MGLNIELLGWDDDATKLASEGSQPAIEAPSVPVDAPESPPPVDPDKVCTNIAVLS